MSSGKRNSYTKGRGLMDARVLDVHVNKKQNEMVPTLTHLNTLNLFLWVINQPYQTIFELKRTLLPCYFERASQGRVWCFPDLGGMCVLRLHQHNPIICFCRHVRALLFLFLLSGITVKAGHQTKKRSGALHHLLECYELKSFGV